MFIDSLEKQFVLQSIGTKFETSLHRDLKFRYAGQHGQTEAEIAGFVTDGINAAGEFIEVQTSHFASLKKKIPQLALLGKVRIVYPVIVTKYIEVSDANGNRKYRRKSPRGGSPWDIFGMLVHAPELPLVAGLTIELALVDALEIRTQDGKGSRRRGGVSIQDRMMTAFHERITLQKPSDYLRFIPFKKNEEFTSRSLGAQAGIPVDVARKVVYVLAKINIIQKVGKQRNAIVYKIVPNEKPPRRRKIG